MIETAMLFDRNGALLCLFQPETATATSLPDTMALWTLLWSARDALGGIAHTHPSLDVAVASSQDLTTFSAVDRALGRALIWPVVATREIVYYRGHDGQYDVVDAPAFSTSTRWLDAIQQLREASA